MRQTTENKLAYLQETKDAIKAKLLEKGVAVKDTDTFRSYADKIEEIKGGSGDAVVWYVTFIGADGSVLFKMPVLDGDDCKDPITHGDITTPTKESSVQYNYTYSGWSATADGSVNSSVLKSITADKTVYAAFTSSTRYYTITYYDTDGVTVVGTESLPYGATAPKITLSKEGYFCSGYSPSFATVIGDASYIVLWSEKVSFATGAWSDIAQVCDGGEASKHFTVGETRTENINGKDYTLEIIGIAADTIYSNYKTAGITVWMKDYDATTTRMQPSYISSTVHNKEKEIFNLLPTDLQSVIKEVRKVYPTNNGGISTKTEAGAFKLWSLSNKEINSSHGVITIGSAYKERFPTSKSATLSTTKTYDEIATGGAFWLRDMVSGGSTYVGATGFIYFTTSASTTCNVKPCFCI